MGMKTKGKLAMGHTGDSGFVRKNDFDVMYDHLGSSISKLSDIVKDVDLSDEERQAVDDVLRQSGIIQAAMKDCAKTERFASPDSRNTQIRQVIDGYAVPGAKVFDNALTVFSGKDVHTVRRFDREVAAAELVSGISDVSGTDYQESYFG